MTYKEASELKSGDLVTIAKRETHYGDMVFEVINTEVYGRYCYHVTLGQPGFNNEFRINAYDSRLLERYPK